MEVKDATGNITKDMDGVISIMHASPILRWIVPFIKKRQFRMSPHQIESFAIHKMQSREPMFIKMFLRMFLVNTMAAFFLFLVIGWNSKNIGSDHLRIPSQLEHIVRRFHLEQHWGMFSPSPPYSQWYYDFKGVMQDGSPVDLWKNGALHTGIPNFDVSPGRPDPFPITFKNHRWFKYFEKGLNSKDHQEEVLKLFRDWMCRMFRAHGYPLQSIDLWMVTEAIHPDLDGKRTMLGSKKIFESTCPRPEGAILIKGWNPPPTDGPNEPMTG
eukprot:TRINITY_DN4446_c0_g2_i1.p1 TRINITY_DN4446_c0_g2~~TRINITY_DN4446_c0_g2_i1.p1  ORF type:complete len:312 (-),score=68.61 TRINITY_DN4446_c0_g2_i1:381-1190(-)